jgi:hypothetical protein
VASLVSPELYFDQLSTQPFFRGRVIKELNILKLVFYIILWQSYKTLRNKRKATSSVNLSDHVEET